MRYQAEGVPLVVLAGKEYGSGSSRDWAAKGTLLLGVRAVIAESYERIHRSNLVGMGVAARCSSRRASRLASLGLDRRGGASTSSGLEALNGGEVPKEVAGARAATTARSREFDGPGAHRHPDGGRVLPPRRASCTTCCARSPAIRRLEAPRGGR